MPTTPRNTNADQDTLNKDAREGGAAPIGYVNEDGGGVLAVQGDNDAPYVIVHGRASSDGSTGLVAETNGAAQRLATDLLGHLWSALFVSGAPVGPANPLPVDFPAGAVGDVNIVQVAGVATVGTLAGTLPVEVVRPTFAVQQDVLGVNGDLAVFSPAGRLQRLSITIFSGSGFLFICDLAATPPTLNSRMWPPIPFNVASLGSPAYIDIDFESTGGLVFANGVVVGISTTGPAFTALVGATGDVIALLVP
jgi:hypothetical protein